MLGSCLFSLSTCWIDFPNKFSSPRDNLAITFMYWNVNFILPVSLWSKLLPNKCSIPISFILCRWQKNEFEHHSKYLMGCFSSVLSSRFLENIEDVLLDKVFHQFSCHVCCAMYQCNYQPLNSSRFSFFPWNIIVLIMYRSRGK